MHAPAGLVSAFRQIVAARDTKSISGALRSSSNFPASVMLALRVLWLSSRTPSYSSRAATYLLVLARERFSASAALEKLPRVATSRNVLISSRESIGEMHGAGIVSDLETV
jgi:hypothetical protein